jgi:hypothetical protein
VAGCIAKTIRKASSQSFARCTLLPLLSLLSGRLWLFHAYSPKSTTGTPATAHCVAYIAESSTRQTAWIAIHISALLRTSPVLEKWFPKWTSVKVSGKCRVSHCLVTSAIENCLLVT